MVYLCGRPLPSSDRCVLGRETAIQPMRWDEDGWLRTFDGTGTPVLEVDGAGLERFDRELLRAVVEKFGGGPVGLSTLAV